MNQPPIETRIFPFHLAPWLPERFGAYLAWLRHLLERLGPATALAIWEQAAQAGEDALLLRILSQGWQAQPEPPGRSLEEALSRQLAQVYPTTVQDISPPAARQLVERMPPFPQAARLLPTLQACKELTAYEALHLRLHGTALLCEALIAAQGKQGELIAYDLLRQERLQAWSGQTGSVTEFIAGFAAPPRSANLFSAGLERRLVRQSEGEVVLHILDCAWARYFQERHPQVGYLVACSTDEAAYRGFNPHLRLQRSDTRMQGAEVCDFRIFSIETGENQ